METRTLRKLGEQELRLASYSMPVSYVRSTR
jgi:hypothetical protein